MTVVTVTAIRAALRRVPFLCCHATAKRGVRSAEFSQHDSKLISVRK